MDDQPARIEMRSPEGTFHVVLERDRALFEGQGYEYAGAHAGGPQTEPSPVSLSAGEAPPVDLEAIIARIDAQIADGERAAEPAPQAPAVEAHALVKPDFKAPARATKPKASK